MFNRRFVLLMASAALMAGCDLIPADFTGKAREGAYRLYQRAANGDGPALEELKTAALDKGNPYAAWQLGFLLQTGVGSSTRDEQSALAAYAPALGKVPQADFNAGLLHLARKDYEAAVERFQFAAGKEHDGMVAAMVQLARIYEAGFAGAPKSASLAAEWFEYAAAAGDVDSKFRLGKIILLGRGRTQDVKQGLEYIQTAAEFGNREAMIFLSNLYARPNVPGIEQSHELAARWLIVGAQDDKRLTEAAEAYLAALPPLEAAHAREAAAIFIAGHPKIQVPPSFSKPVNE